jgi:transposase
MHVSAESVLDPRDKRILQQAELIEQHAGQIRMLESEIVRLKELLEKKAAAKTAKTPNFSLDRNKRNKQEKNTKKSTSKRGRKKQQAKLKRVTQVQKVFPEGVDPKECELRRTQFVWRIVDGKAIYVAYHIYERPDAKELPLPPAVRNSRTEFGIEIILILAFLHYWIGVSLDHACQIMNFFTGLELPKSQAHSLLKQLARDWDEQYDTIAELIALQMIVYIDETGWKVGDKSCYTWVFSTAMHVLYRCGVSRKKDEATAVLGDDFAGIGVTDDYAAYKSMFSQHQLCWAHLIRKAIKLALLHPDEQEYGDFLDQLCKIYDDAKELSRDQAANNPQAAEATEIDAILAKLQARISDLCSRHDEVIVKPKTDGDANSESSTGSVEVTPKHLETFILLQRELMNNRDCLFVFVEHPDVEPTNNRSERNVRREAEIRKGARTSKTSAGAKRRGTIVSVLASLHTRLSPFTLSNLLSEVMNWFETGSSIFERELANHRANPPTAAAPS